MERTRRCFILLLLMWASHSILSGNPVPLSHESSTIELKSFNSQLYFEENTGQFEPAIQFQALAFNRMIRFLDQGISFAEVREKDAPRVESEETRKFENYRWFGEREADLEALVWNLSFAETRENLKPVGKEVIPGRVNYFMGNDPTKWTRRVKRYRELWYEDIYQGIDLRYYGTDMHQLKYDFVLAPGADINQIKMVASGIEGLDINEHGELLIETQWGLLTDAAPYSYQEVNGEEIPVNIQYKVLKGSAVGFEISGPYNPELPIILDPITLTWSSFLHSSTSDDYIMAVERDSDDNVYMTGYTKSMSFPISTGVYQNAFGGNIDCYVAKLAANGDTLCYATYIGGGDWELAYGIGLNANKEVYLSGFARSTNYPMTSGAFQTTYGGGLVEGFISKVSVNGDSLMYSSYLGGSDREYIYDLAIDNSGNAYAVGYTISSDYPVSTGAYSSPSSGNGDVFVTKILADGSAIDYSVVLGGSSYDIGNCIAVNAAGEVFVGGNTGSSNFPTTAGVIQPSANFVSGSTMEDGFLFRLAADGSSLTYSTYMGGTNSDGIYSLDVNASNEVFVGGTTYSNDLATTTDAYQTGSDPNIGNGDLFISRINATGTAQTYTTYLGGSDTDFAKALRVNSAGQAHILGATRSVNWPTTGGSAASAMYDIFLTVISPDGQSLEHSELFGGSLNDYPRASDAIYLANDKITVGVTTHSTDMDMAGSTYQTAKTNGVNDAPWIATLEVNTVLPHDIMSFSANWVESRQKNLLSWRTTDLYLLSEFVIERRSVATKWKAIGTVPAHEDQFSYSFSDVESGQLKGEELYYRIKIKDVNGTIGYSDVQRIAVPVSQKSELTFYPNPTRDRLNIEVELSSTDVSYIQIVDSRGALMLSQPLPSATIAGDNFEQTYDLSEWPGGVYYIHLSNDSGTPIVRKFVHTPE